MEEARCGFKRDERHPPHLTSEMQKVNGDQRNMSGAVSTFQGREISNLGYSDGSAAE